MDESRNVVKILSDVAGEFCNHYCKWPDLWDEEAEGKELCESEHCEKCPCNLLSRNPHKDRMRSHFNGSGIDRYQPWLRDQLDKSQAAAG